jgi:hypothetical protein
MLLGSVGQCLGNHINEIKRNFPPVTFSKKYDAFTRRMDSLVSTNDDVFSRLPFETPLPGNDVIGHHLLSSKLFESAI